MFVWIKILERLFGNVSLGFMKWVMILVWEVFLFCLRIDFLFRMIMKMNCFLFVWI